MTKPALFTWGTDPSANLPPGGVPVTVRALGFADGTRARADYVNRALADLSDWLAFLDPFFAADEDFRTGRITGTGDTATSKGLYVTTTSGAVKVQPAANGALEVVTTGTGAFSATIAAASTWTFTGGWTLNVGSFASGPDFTINTDKLTINAWSGVEVNGYVQASLGFAIASTAYTVHASPAQGGFVQLDGNAATGQRVSAQDEWLAESPGAGQSRTWRCPLRFDGAGGTTQTLTNMRVRAFADGAVADVLRISLYEVTTFGSPVTRTLKAQFKRVSGGTAISVNTEYDVADNVPGDIEISIPSATVRPDRHYYVEIRCDWHSNTDSIGVQQVAFDLTKTDVF